MYGTLLPDGACGERRAGLARNMLRERAGLWRRSLTGACKTPRNPDNSGEKLMAAQANPNDDQTTKDLAALQDDFQQLREDLHALRESVAKTLQSGTEAGKERAQEELERLAEQFKETYDSVRKQSKQTKKSLENEIEERPFTYVLGALIVGLVVGKLFTSGR
jgi:ElaB/YqjD/DUF883 family membrane-anchored ribosome-binding protein